MSAKYMSTSGMATRQWGPSGWEFLFSCIMGGYPPVIEAGNPEHVEVKHHFKKMFVSLGYTMPCIFCRQSYQLFCKELPIDAFLSGRLELMSWLYLIRDKVNRKLMKQERECYIDEKRRLQRDLSQRVISKEMYYAEKTALRRKTLFTRPSPPFKEVLDTYESMRATCSTKTKTCAKD